MNISESACRHYVWKNKTVKIAFYFLLQHVAHIWLPESSEKWPTLTTNSTGALGTSVSISRWERAKMERGAGYQNAISSLREPTFPGCNPVRQSECFPRVPGRSALGCIAHVGGLPLCLCTAIDFTPQFTFQFTKLQTNLDIRPRAGRSKPAWHCSCQLARSFEREQNHWEKMCLPSFWQWLNRATSLGKLSLQKWVGSTVWVHKRTA